MPRSSFPPRHQTLIQIVAHCSSRLSRYKLYCERHLVECFFNIIKHFRAIATRYEKTAWNFLAGVHLVCALFLLK